MNTFTIQPPQQVHILILGGGFGGMYTARHLQRLFKRDPHVHITLVDRHNYFLMTPLLFEAGSGILEPRHAVAPLRGLFSKTRFVEAQIKQIDLPAKVVRARHGLPPGDMAYELPYDHLVLALGGITNRQLIPGSEHALAFKTLRDAIGLRNHIIDLFEQAHAQGDPARRAELLTFVIIGGGLVGVELMGELTEFVANLARSYPRLEKLPKKFFLLEAADKILPEMDRDLADYAQQTLARRGVDIRTATPVQAIEPARVYLPDGSVLTASTILLAAGVAANPLIADLPLEQLKHRVATDRAMRSKTDPHVWALGDCAAIPDAGGKIYPQLAQHALRQARVLARNIAAVVRAQQAGLAEPKLQPFNYQTLGTLAALGHYSGVGRLLVFKIKGFLAWWVWRTYYLMQMPQWNRRFRIVLDWTTALLFRNDIVKLDFDRKKGLEKIEKM